MKFQFLMVRLKVSSKSLSKSVPKNISIPYGAIKSQTGFQRKVWRQNISIPYGAIKREQDNEQNSLYKVISIPYGAIKRFHKNVTTTKDILFQFLMVRLKVSLSKIEKKIW